jgi:primary-amine oxidase
VSLREPPKEAVYKHTGQGSLRREANAVLIDNATNSCYEAAVSLTDQKLLSRRHVPGVQPTMTADEQVECEQAELASHEFKSALKKQYGIDDTRLVMVDIWSAGYFGQEEERTRRLARPLWFVRTDPSEISSAMRIGVYNCLYVALAEREKCELVSWDDQLVKILQATIPYITSLASLP